MLATLLLIILQATATLPLVAQIANYILLVVNAIYTLFIIPTYREYRAVVKDYNDRTSPKYLEAIKIIQDKEKEEFIEIIAAIKDIKHDVNAIRQERVNLDVVFKQMDEIQEDIRSLRNKSNRS